MVKRSNLIIRKLAPVVGAGMLLQAGGCTFDLQTVTQGLVTSVANNLLASFVFGLFNVPLTGF